MKSYHISNSGPVRYVAPISRASIMDSRIRFMFPSKSNAHWFNVETATVTFRPILSRFGAAETKESEMSRRFVVIKRMCLRGRTK